MPSPNRLLRLLAFLVACGAGAGWCGSVSAAEVDPWFTEAIKPWQKLSTIRSTCTESRGSLFPQAGNDVVVSRSVTWLWSAKTGDGFLAITGGPRPVLSAAAKSNPQVALHLNLEYGRDWTSRSFAYGRGRVSSLDDETGRLETALWNGGVDSLLYDYIEVVPLYPFEFLKRCKSNSIVKAIAPEQLRDPLLIKRKWAELQITTKVAEAARHTCSGSFPTLDDTPDRVEGFEFVIERDAATQVPVITTVTLIDLTTGKPWQTSTFSYDKHQLADGTPIPICAAMHASGPVRNHVAILNSCVIDKPIPLDEMTIDVSKARQVYDGDSGVTINVDAGGK
jgi:hypothetical protein